MYTIESYTGGVATIVNSAEFYRCPFNAATEVEAQRIVVGLNKPWLLSQLAALRFNFEIGGITLANGLSIKTDRESQAQLNSAYVTLDGGLIPDTDWKGANGWQLVDLEEIKPIAKAVAAHGRGCFRGERLVQTAINEASSMDDIEAIDIPVMFASAYQDAYAEVMTPEQAAE